MKVSNHFCSLKDIVDIFSSDQNEKRQLLTAGLPVGRGLTAKAARELGLIEGTPVGSGVIDASVERLLYGRMITPSLPLAMQVGLGLLELGTILTRKATI